MNGGGGGDRVMSSGGGEMNAGVRFRKKLSPI
jgi:hypothetical protein